MKCSTWFPLAHRPASARVIICLKWAEARSSEYCAAADLKILSGAPEDRHVLEMILRQLKYEHGKGRSGSVVVTVVVEVAAVVVVGLGDVVVVSGNWKYRIQSSMIRHIPAIINWNW